MTVTPELKRAESSIDDALKVMANDPAIQYELKQISTEFAVAESDGLDGYPSAEQR